MSKRVIMPAKSLNNPFSNEIPSRCRKKNKQDCMLIGDIFQEENGCNYCIGIKNSWVARKWLLQRISDSEIEQTSVYEFPDKYPELYEELANFSNKNGYPDPSKLYSDIRQLGSYTDIEPIKVDGNTVINGRHRCRIDSQIVIINPRKLFPSKHDIYHVFFQLHSFHDFLLI